MSATPSDIINAAKSAGASPEQVVILELAFGLLDDAQAKDKIDSINEFEKYCAALGIEREYI